MYSHWMGMRAFARVAACGCLVAVSQAALAQEGPATTAPASAPNPPSTPLPALPAATMPATTPPATPVPPTTWAPSSGIELRLDGRVLRVRVGPSEAILDLGCTGRSTLQSGDRAFIACGADGVVEVDLANPLAPRRAGAMPVDGEATALFLRDGRVWVEIAHYFARPVRTDGVVAAPGRRAVAALQSGDAPAGGPPTVVERATPSIMAPPRRGDLWELSAEAGAFVNLGPSSGGVVGWASAVYRFDLPIVVRLELAPIAFGAGNGITTVSSAPSGTTTTVNGPDSGATVNSSTGSRPGSGSIAVGAVQALIGVDTQFVEVAIGGGAATLGNPSGTGSFATGGSSIATEARFGARDGLAITLESIVVSANGQFSLGSFVATVQVPLTPTVMLVARGGGGNVGVLFGDLGARLLVAGDGGPGTLALTGFFGGEGINFQGCSSDSGTFGGGVVATCPYASLGGPSIGGGIEWRR
jgi:hypothetical protein